MKNTLNKSHMETEKVAIVFGDCTLGVKSGNTHYIFSYTRGGLESLNKNGKEWLYRETLPVFWRATTDNDRGSGFGFNRIRQKSPILYRWVMNAVRYEGYRW
ncbi:hypothetical protein P8946_11010 [Enterococcus faecium]|nr:hypothetical protein [Enterococcus faecium]MDG4614951.1 hypothetical protein [Enterococcus faecium]